jgi:hypothetical protein
MRKPNPIHPILLSVTVLLLVSLACTGSVTPGVPAPTQDLNFLGTVIASTLSSGASQTAVAGVPSTVVATPTPWPTFTPVPPLPTFTPSATLSPIPLFTSTSLVPLISVSVATNCRVGPGKVYERVGALLVGEVAEVFGRSATGNYWYIRNPRQSNGFCWLWGEYATVTGNFAALPIFTPPPTPTPVPNFRAAYARLEKCNNRWWVDIRLANTGGMVFQSISLVVKDLRTNIVVSMSSDIFENIDGCTNTSSKDALQPGVARVVSSHTFTYDPTGHKLRATITLCSREGQNGMCIRKSIRFTVQGID